MEQIRIIREMRDADAGRGRTGKFIRPRFMVWENVPGAFSSNKGNDFRAVLEETIRIAEPDAPDVPLPPKGKWPLADCWYGDGWSVAYRVLDAQFWGVPQRRRRIALVADFGGHAAPEILFARQGVCGDTAESGAAGEETAAGAGGGADRAMRSGTDHLTGWDNQEKRIFSTKGVTPTISGSDGRGGRTLCGYVYCGELKGKAEAGGGAGEAIPINTMLATRHKQLGRGTGFGIGEPGDPGFTISTNHSHAVFQPGSVCRGENEKSTVCIQGAMIRRSETARPMGKGWRDDDIAYTLDTKAPHVICAGFKHKAGAAAGNIGYQEETAPTLSAEQTSAVYVQQNQLGEVRTGPEAGALNINSSAGGRKLPLMFDARGNGDGKTACTLTGDHQSRVTDYTCLCIETGQASAAAAPQRDLAPTLNCNHEQPVLSIPEAGIVRRLTPLECERLQGYPDGWTDIGPWTDSEGKRKKCKDAARYKALGNSIALPPWTWVLKRLYACYERPATMASLFDGIGGFPLIWERLNGPGSCLWASEIEEFPIAVTKARFDGKNRW